MATLTIEDTELPAELYHYTRASGLKGILDSHCLWASHAAFLNDAHEIIYGQQKVLKVLDDWLKRFSLPDELKDDSLWHPNINGVAKWIGGKFLISFAKTIIEQTTTFLSQNLGPFVACLSTSRDQLSQWRGYAGDGGYAIMFDGKALQRCASTRVQGTQLKFDSMSETPVEIGRRHFVKMEYDTSHEYYFDGVVTFFQRLLSHIASENKDDPEFDQELFKSTGQAIVQQQMGWILSAIMQAKNPGFQEENEYRILTFAEPDRMDPSPFGLVPRVDIGFEPACVTEILVGAGLHQEVRHSSVEYYCNARPEFAHVKVVSSKTPFRGM